jgi:hypothetical protein
LFQLKLNRDCPPFNRVPFGFALTSSQFVFPLVSSAWNLPLYPGTTLNLSEFRTATVIFQSQAISCWILVVVQSLDLSGA